MYRECECPLNFGLAVSVLLDPTFSRKRDDANTHSLKECGVAPSHLSSRQVSGRPILDTSGSGYLGSSTWAASASTSATGTAASGAPSSSPPEAADALSQALREHQATRGAVARAALLESDTEADTDAEPAGAGIKGVGVPMRVGSHEAQRDLCDGAGLCSLGVWPPWQRPEVRCPRLRLVRSLILDYMSHLEANIGYTVHSFFDALAEGKVMTSPFEDRDSGFRALVDAVLHVLSHDGEHAYARVGDVPQEIRIRLLQRVLQLGGDPDYPLPVNLQAVPRVEEGEVSACKSICFCIALPGDPVDCQPHPPSLPQFARRFTEQVDGPNERAAQTGPPIRSRRYAEASHEEHEHIGGRVRATPLVCPVVLVHARQPVSLPYVEREAAGRT